MLCKTSGAPLQQRCTGPGRRTAHLRCSPVARRNVLCALGPSAVELEVLEQYKKANTDDKTKTLNTLRKAVTAKSVPPPEVEGAILNLEQLTGLDKTPRVIEGRWLLVFGTATKIQAFRYIPVVEDFVINTPAKKVSLESEVGPFSVRFEGPSSGYDASTGSLDFQWNRAVVGLHSNGLLGTRQLFSFDLKPKPKTWTFFYCDGEIAAARSSFGGVALLRKRVNVSKIKKEDTAN